MKELLAACKGKKLKEREIEARIQHFLSVLKVTLLKSTQVDFASESWKGARLYHDKDQQKIDIFFFLYQKNTYILLAQITVIQSTKYINGCVVVFFFEFFPALTARNSVCVV